MYTIQMCERQRVLFQHFTFLDLSAYFLTHLLHAHRCTVHDAHCFAVVRRNCPRHTACIVRELCAAEHGSMWVTGNARLDDDGSPEATQVEIVLLFVIRRRLKWRSYLRVYQNTQLPFFPLHASLLRGFHEKTKKVKRNLKN